MNESLLMSINKLFLALKLTKNCYFFVVIFFIAMAFSLRASASPDIKLIVLDMEPWALISPQNSNQLMGILPDIIREIEKRTNIVIKINIASYPRIYRELENGRGDCTILNLQEKYHHNIIKGARLLELPFGVIAQKKTGEINKNSLKKLPISFVNDGMFYDEKHLPPQKEYDSSYAIGFKKMGHNRVQAIAGAIPTIQYIARENAVDHLLGSPLVLFSEPIYFQCSQNSSSLRYMKNINQAIQSMKQDSTLNKIFEKYKY